MFSLLNVTLSREGAASWCNEVFPTVSADSCTLGRTGDSETSSGTLATPLLNITPRGAKTGSTSCWQQQMKSLWRRSRIWWPRVRAFFPPLLLFCKGSWTWGPWDPRIWGSWCCYLPFVNVCAPFPWRCSLALPCLRLLKHTLRLLRLSCWSGFPLFWTIFPSIYDFSLKYIFSILFKMLFSFMKKNTLVS